jgi:hypothetical protein
MRTEAFNRAAKIVVDGDKAVRDTPFLKQSDTEYEIRKELAPVLETLTPREAMFITDAWFTRNTQGEPPIASKFENDKTVQAFLDGAQPHRGFELGNIGRPAPVKGEASQLNLLWHRHQAQQFIDQVKSNGNVLPAYVMNGFRSNIPVQNLLQNAREIFTSGAEHIRTLQPAADRDWLVGALRSMKPDSTPNAGDYIGDAVKQIEAMAAERISQLKD